MNQTIDLKRTLQYFRLKIDLNKRIFLIGLAGFYGFTLIVTFFIANNIQPGYEYILNNFHMGAFMFMLFAGGILITARSFHDMNTSEKSLTQIMIPASTFEKFITPLISSTIVWMLLSVVSYEIFALVTNGLWTAVFGFSTEMFNIFDFVKQEDYSQLLKVFFIIHSIFFLGATAFRKYPIGKTILANFLVNSIFTFFTLFLILIIFGSFVNFGIASSSYVEEFFIGDAFNKIKIYSEWIFIVIIPIVLYFVAFFKLKEREV